MDDLRRITLFEGKVQFLGPEDQRLAHELSRLKVATVEPSGSSEWRISGVSKIGVLRLGDIEVRIEPKVPIANVFYLLSRGQQWGKWFDDSVQLGSVDDLYRVIAETFAAWCERILARGALRGYVGVRAAEPTIRGRWLVDEQIRRRGGIPLPAELSYDDFTADIPENQLVRAAVRRLLTMPALPAAVRARLRRSDRALADVEPTRRGVAAPSISFDRRNERYRPLIALARLIHDDKSIEHRTGNVLASGFLLDLPRVFEDYIAAAVADAVAPYGGVVLSQDARPFDRGGLATIKPDLIWVEGGRGRAVFDAKYKAEKPEGYPNADLYQALAYAVRLRLPSAHLVYAKGSAAPARYEIAELGKTVFAHALDLAKAPSSIEEDVRALVAQAATA